MILVTGATGLVGSHLVLYLLEKGYPVKAMFKSESKKQRVKTLFEYYKKEEYFDAIHWCEADILDIPSLDKAFQSVEYVYHCAGFISFDPKKEEQLRKINIEGTQNIVNFCLHFQVKKLCHVSSIAALGSLNPNQEMITEENEWNPESNPSDYAISKYGAEIEVWRAQEEGLNTIIVNPGVILGPPIWTDGSGELYSLIKKEIPFYTTGSTGFISIHDVVIIVEKLMQSCIVGERFILISENKSYKELQFTLADVFKLKKPQFKASKWITNVAWKADWFLSVFFNKKRRLTKHLSDNFHSKEIYSNLKIRNALSFQFEKMDSFLAKFG